MSNSIRLRLAIALALGVTTPLACVKSTENGAANHAAASKAPLAAGASDEDTVHGKRLTTDDNRAKTSSFERRSLLLPIVLCFAGLVLLAGFFYRGSFTKRRWRQRP